MATGTGRTGPTRGQAKKLADQVEECRRAFLYVIERLEDGYMPHLTDEKGARPSAWRAMARLSVLATVCEQAQGDLSVLALALPEKDGAAGLSVGEWVRYDPHARD